MGDRLSVDGRVVSVAGTLVALALLLVGGAVAAETTLELVTADGPALAAPGVGVAKGASGLVVAAVGLLALRTVARRDASPPSEDAESDSEAASAFIWDG